MSKYLYNGALGDTIALAYTAKLVFSKSDLATKTFYVNYPEVFDGIANAIRIKAKGSMVKSDVSISNRTSFKASTIYKNTRDCFWYLKSLFGLRYQYIPWSVTFKNRNIPLINIFAKELGHTDYKIIKTLPKNIKFNTKKVDNVVIGFEAGWACRKPLDESILILLKYLNKKNKSIKIVGNLKQKDFFSKYEDLRGQLTLKELIKVVSNADLVITADSGLFHIAQLLQKNTISLFGPVDPILRSYPNHKTLFMYRDDLECIGCSSKIDISRFDGKCPLIHNECMNFSNDFIKRFIKKCVDL